MLYQFKNIWIAIFLSFTILIYCESCTDDNSQSNLEEIVSYFNRNKLNITDTLGNVLVYVIDEGSIEKPRLDSTKSITFSYVGYYLDGTVFDQSQDSQQITLTPNSILEGVRIGMTKIGRGGNGIIGFTPELGFGGSPPIGVRSNASLIYKVSITDFK